MATLVLTVVGGVLGGPPGAAIGATIGNAVDHAVLFKPKGREGPRLSDLRVQTSSYGTQIPKQFGTMRVAGSVIWATDLVEHRSSSGGGKGRPSTTSYSYTASFAVALSARPILGVGRIWADGKLLRGAAGDLKTRTRFRLHLGGEDQAADPLIAAAEGAALAPAHRGTAYAVFEDLELGDFGNRIPSLTFEVEADAGPVSAGAVLGEIGEGAIVCPGESRALAGFSAYGASVRTVAETIAGADCGWFADAGDGIALLSGVGEGVALADEGMRAANGKGTRGIRAIAAADSAPRILTLTHYDPARDHQIGIQRATRPGAGNREARLELPAAIDAAGAKTIAAAALARLDIERERRTIALGWDALDVTPGARVTIEGVPGLWRVDRWTLEAMVVTLECVAIAPGTFAEAASGGRVLSAPDLAIGATLLEAFELPPLDDSLAAAPRLGIAAAGTGPGWRSAALLLSTDDGATWSPLGGTALPAVIGTLVSPPGAAPAAVVDRATSFEVELAHEAMTLADADADALDAGANLAMVGDELLQFGHAEPLGGTRWRLDGLWRGRRGTEAAIGTQAEGDRFVLIARDALATADLPVTAIGGLARVLGEGAGDDPGGVEATAAIGGISVLPPCPVHLDAELPGDSTTRVRWIRRSRAGWRWIDGVDAPIGEESERYRVEIVPADGAARIEEAATPECLLAAADRTGACTVTVRQIGSHGLSASASITLPPLGEST